MFPLDENYILLVLISGLISNFPGIAYLSGYDSSDTRLRGCAFSFTLKLMTTKKLFLQILISGMMLQIIQAGTIVVNPNDDLNKILKNAIMGDTILVKQGKYAAVTLSERNFSEKNPLVISAFSSVAYNRREKGR
jgi:hypothetical protein